MAKISSKTKKEAVKDYLSSNDTIQVVAERNSMSYETLRKALGKKARSRGRAPVEAQAARPLDPKGVKIRKTRRKYRKASKAKAPNGCKQWTPAEDSILRDAVYENMSVRETCKLLGRSRIAVYGRKHYLIGTGYIHDNTRFIVEKGIKRRRHLMEASVQEGIPVVETVVTDNVSGDLKYSKDHVLPQKVANLDLDTLARMVKEYGVNVTVCFNDDTMEVRMTS